jgi:hypothetical protein
MFFPRDPFAEGTDLNALEKIGRGSNVKLTAHVLVDAEYHKIFCFVHLVPV